MSLSPLFIPSYGAPGTTAVSASTLTLASLRDDLALMLGCVAERFDADAQTELLRVAAADMARARPVYRRAALTLVADQADYPAPGDLLYLVLGDWGQAQRRSHAPWDAAYPGPLPRVRVVDVAGVATVELDPPPTAAQIASLGAEYRYTYAIRHYLSEDTPTETTVPDAHRDLLLLRALAEAMRRLAAQNVLTPVSLGAAGNNLPRNGAPASLAEQFSDAWIEACRR